MAVIGIAYDLVKSRGKNPPKKPYGIETSYFLLTLHYRIGVSVVNLSTGNSGKLFKKKTIKKQSIIQFVIMLATLNQCRFLMKGMIIYFILTYIRFSLPPS